MKIEIENLTKRYRFKPIIKSLNFVIQSGQHFAVKGPNGSGKSTLLKIISGFLSPSEGKITYSLSDDKIDRGEIWRHLSYAAPYIDLISSYTVEEYLNFHLKLRSFRNKTSISEFLEYVHLERHKSKLTDHLSSGMKQRLKLGICLFTEADLIILDEPGTNLDTGNHFWLMNTLKFPVVASTTCLIASNDMKDLTTCVDEIELKES